MRHTTFSELRDALADMGAACCLQPHLAMLPR
jgi:hypothetical protein